LTFKQLGISSIQHFTNLPFNQFSISSTCRFIIAQKIILNKVHGKGSKLVPLLRGPIGEHSIGFFCVVDKMTSWSSAKLHK
jgi:hypothetical protein